jgi:hypothetical protein
MKTLETVRWAAFLITLLASADAVAAQTIADRPMYGSHAKCERCGQTGPTIPEVPVVLRGCPAFDFELPQGPVDGSPAAPAEEVRSNSAVPVRDEFVLDSERPAVGAAFTR